MIFLNKILKSKHDINFLPKSRYHKTQYWQELILSHRFVPFNFFTPLFHSLAIHVAPLMIQLNNSIIISSACIGLYIICDNYPSNFLDQMVMIQDVNFLVTNVFFLFFPLYLFVLFLFLCVLFQIPLFVVFLCHYFFLWVVFMF